MYSMLTNDEEEAEGSGASELNVEERVGLLSVAEARGRTKREAMHLVADAA